MTTVKQTNGGMKLFTSVKALNAAIAEIKIRGTSYQIDMHVLACSVLQHVGKHGNINIVTQFLEALPDAVRVNALRDWFEAFSKVTWIGGDGKAMKTPAYAKSKTQRLGDAMEKPFWRFKANEGAPYVPLVLSAFLDRQIKVLEKDQANTGADHKALILALKTYNVAPAVTATVN